MSIRHWDDCGLVQFVDAPTEIANIPHSFKLITDKKSIFLFAETEEDHMAWRRRIREAVRTLRTAAANVAADASEDGHGTPVTSATEGGGSGNPVLEGIPTDALEEPSTYGFHSAAIPQAGAPLLVVIWGMWFIR